MFKTIMAVALAATASVASAQHFDANVAVGGHAGYTLSKVSFNPSVPQGMLGGLEAGVAFRYIEERHFGLIAEAGRSSSTATAISFSVASPMCKCRFSPTSILAATAATSTSMLVRSWPI